MTLAPDYTKTLSPKQQATIRVLSSGAKTTSELCDLVEVGKGAGSMMTALQSHGLVKYLGGQGVKPGKGRWQLTERGHQAASMLIKLVCLFLLFVSTAAHAQSFGLPKIDSISFYGELGDFESHEAKNLQPVVFGYGFETAFNVASGDAHTVELALGYDQFAEHFSMAGYTFDGEIRDLPAISVYFSFKYNIYIGLSTGIVSLVNGSTYTPTSKFTVSGDTFDAAGKVGYALPFQPSKPLEQQRVYGFIEADYHARWFAGLNYGMGAPPNLPTRIYLGGATACLGIQIMLDAAKAKVGTKPAVKATP